VGCSFSGLQILDLGTGTGTSAFFAAKNGAQSVGIEISASAIKIAKENAKKLGLSAEFILGDVLSLNLDRKFDVVIDSTILHCLVGLKDRRNLYSSAKLHMKSDSDFSVNTMIASSDISSRFPKEYFIYQDEVLWSLGINEVSERKIIDGKSYFPHRTILSEEKQLDEFNENGFELVMSEKVID
jgi:cyclopropane fatty-acyl-phospholipid synthase-like methyltransferase